MDLRVFFLVLSQCACVGSASLGAVSLASVPNVRQTSARASSGALKRPRHCNLGSHINNGMSMSELKSVEPEGAKGPFASLLRSTGWDEFFGTYWGQRPLHIRDCQAQLQALPGLAEFPQLLAGKFNGESWDQGIHAPYGSFMDRRGNMRVMIIGACTWAQAYNAGVSLCFGGVTTHSRSSSMTASDRFPSPVRCTPRPTWLPLVPAARCTSIASTSSFFRSRMRSTGGSLGAQRFPRLR